EGEMLGMAFFKSLVKHHGKTYFEPVGKLLAAEGIREPNLLNPAHVMKLLPVAWPYLKWNVARRLMGSAAPKIPDMPRELRGHAVYACEQLQAMALEISGTMQKFQLSLADRQCRMAELSGRCQDLITILATSMYAGREQATPDPGDELIRQAADLLCQKLRDKLTCKRPSNAYFKQVTSLGAEIAKGGFPGTEEIDPGEIMMKYDRA
ncbi:MAG: acyl-CoA dehydrogenase, partial [Planctomycetales bacterium]|nr:acyl-CoA dehydrogenase [Planctomycetales bacterium]